VLLEVLGGAGRRARASAEALKQAYGDGGLLVCEVAFAEVRSHFATDEAFGRTLEALGLRLDPLSAEAAALAGRIWQKWRGRQGVRLEDCLVAGHAATQADRLLTLRAGLYRRLCPGLKAVSP
jgi:predicted nucleic acid-binding protein